MVKRVMVVPDEVTPRARREYLYILIAPISHPPKGKVIEVEGDNSIVRVEPDTPLEKVACSYGGSDPAIEDFTKTESIMVVDRIATRDAEDIAIGLHRKGYETYYGEGRFLIYEPENVKNTERISSIVKCTSKGTIIYIFDRPTKVKLLTSDVTRIEGRSLGQNWTYNDDYTYTLVNDQKILVYKPRNGKIFRHGIVRLLQTLRGCADCGHTIIIDHETPQKQEWSKRGKEFVERECIIKTKDIVRALLSHYEGNVLFIKESGK